MFGISYGELFLILGATAALIGPKDLPRIARTAGKLAGRAIGYVQMARGQFDNVMQQSQASQVHKELQETMAQLEAIRYEIRSISIMNPAPFTRKLDSANLTPNNSNSDNINDDDLPGTSANVMPNGQSKSTMNIPKGLGSVDMKSSRLYSEATTYARLAEAPNIKSGLVENIGDGGVKLGEEKDGLFTVLPVSAENAGFLSKRTDEPKGSDIVLEAILEAEVAHKAKQFFSQPENQIPQEMPKDRSELSKTSATTGASSATKSKTLATTGASSATQPAASALTVPPAPTEAPSRTSVPVDIGGGADRGTADSLAEVLTTPLAHNSSGDE